MTIRIVVAGAAALALGLGVSPGPAMAKTPTDQLIVGMNMANMLGLDPHEINQFEPVHVFSNAYDQLIQTDSADPAKIEPLAAVAWQIGADGSLTFTLREGMKFASGRPVTVDDVIWSLSRLLLVNKSGASDLKEMGYTAENIGQKLRKIDERTLILEPASPITPALKLYTLAKPLGSILDRATIEAQAKGDDRGAAFLATNIAGSGPFKLTRWAPNDIAILERNDGYWAGPAKMKRAVIRHIPESQTQRLQLEKGDLDVGYSLSGADFDGLARHPDIVIQKVPGGGHYYFSISMKDPDLGKRDVRQALRWCIDYEGINSGIMANYGISWQRHVLPGLLASLPDLQYRLDVDRCRAELAAAGYPNGMKKKLRVLTQPPFKEIATAIQATMAKVGVEIEILPGDGGQVYGAMRNRDFEMLVGRGGSGFIPDPHDTLQSTAYNPDNRDAAKLTGNAAWRASWSVPAVNELLERGLATADPKARERIYIETQDLIEKEVSWIFPISQRVDPLAVHKRVKNYVGAPTWMTRWEVVEKSD